MSLYNIYTSWKNYTRATFSLQKWLVKIFLENSKRPIRMLSIYVAHSDRSKRVKIWKIKNVKPIQIPVTHVRSLTQVFGSLDRRYRSINGTYSLNEKRVRCTAVLNSAKRNRRAIPPILTSLALNRACPRQILIPPLRRINYSLQRAIISRQNFRSGRRASR